MCVFGSSTLGPAPTAAAGLPGAAYRCLSMMTNMEDTMEDKAACIATCERLCWSSLPTLHSLHPLLWRWCGQTLRGFFLAASPVASASPCTHRLPVTPPAGSAGAARSSPEPAAVAVPCAHPAEKHFVSQRPVFLEGLPFRLTYDEDRWRWAPVRGSIGVGSRLAGGAWV